MKLTNKIVSVLTSGLLVTSLSLTVETGNVFANGSDSELPVVQEGTLTESTEPDAVADGEAVETTELPVTDEINEDDTVTEGEEETSTLVPGDFFYFVKIMAENIRLAVTFDDYKEAQLLAEFAAERIEEANSLIKDGKSDEAATLLQAAIDTQNQAEEELSETDLEDSEETVVEEEVQEDDLEETEDVQAEDDLPEVELVQGKLAANIDALLMAMAKVENPTAQKALMKNIQKSFEKLEKKLGKRGEVLAKFDEKMMDIEDKLAGGTISQEEASEEIEELEEELDEETDEIEEEVEEDEDTQLQRAIDLLKSWKVFKELPKVS